MKTCRIKVAFTAAALAALCGQPALAQSADSASNSGAAAGSNSTAGAAAGANNSTSGSNSASNSGAVAGAGASSNANNQSGAMANQELGVTIVQPVSPSDTTSKVVQEIHNSGSLKTAPGFFTPAPASGPCTGTSGGLTGSWLGGGFGASLAVVDPSCTIRENLRVLTAIAPLLAGDEQKQIAGQLVMDLLAAMRANMPGSAAAK